MKTVGLINPKHVALWVSQNFENPAAQDCNRKILAAQRQDMKKDAW